MQRKLFLLLTALLPALAWGEGKSLVDAQTDSLISNHKIVYIDGPPIMPHRNMSILYVK